MLKMPTRPAIALLATVFIALSPLQAAAEQASGKGVVQTIGAHRVTIPAPAGFQDPTGLAPSVERLILQLVPPTNRQLAAFIEPSDIALSAAGKAVPLRRYFIAQTLRASEGKELSPSRFAEIKAAVEKEQQKSFDSVVSQVQSQFDTKAGDMGKAVGSKSLDLKLGEVRPVGTFANTATSYSFGFLMNIAANAGQGKTERTLAVGTTFILVKDKLLYLYVYSQYQGMADVDWVRNASRDWAAAVQREN